MLLLFLCAFIWGTAFVAQSSGMDYVGPFTFAAVRYVLGGLVLIPVILFRSRKIEKKSGSIRPLLIPGIICGVCLCIASNLQQVGILYTTVGKAGFITALYIIIVPILGLFFKNKVKINVWIAAVISVIGAYLLCMKSGDFSITKGDILVLLCAVAFSVHILVIDKFSPRVDGIMLASMQFFVAGIISFIPALIFEQISITSIFNAAVPILYAGVLSSGVAYTLQIVGQKKVEPTAASLIMSLESVVSALSGWFLLNQKMSWIEILGCVIMFAGTVLAQLKFGKKSV